jgi:hypothetical protein
MLQQRSNILHTNTTGHLTIVSTLIFFGAGLLCGWKISSDENGISSDRYTVVSRLRLADYRDTNRHHNWVAEQVAVAAIPDEDQRHQAALRLAERVFRRDPADVPRFARWMRQLFPEESARHSSEWTLIRPQRRSKDPDALDAIVAPFAFAVMVADPETVQENGKTPFYLADQAGAADPKQFLALLDGVMSDDCRAGVFANYPSEAHANAELRDRLLQEVANGKGCRSALESSGFRLVAEHLKPAEASALLASAASTMEDGLADIKSSNVMHLTMQALRDGPESVLRCLPAGGSGRHWMLKACAASAVSPDAIPGLTAVERAAYLSEHLASSTTMTATDVKAAVDAIESLPGPDAMAAARQLVQSIVSDRGDPTAALGAAAGFQNPLARSAFMETLVRQWAEADVVGASEALSRLPRGSMPDAAIAALVGEIHSDPVAAVVWAERMSSRASGLELARKVLADSPSSQHDVVSRTIGKLWPE